MNRQILIIGHSHLGSYRTADRNRGIDGHPGPRVRTIFLKDSAYGGEMEGDDFSPAVKAAIMGEMAAKPVVASVIGGSAHALLSMFAFERLDFVLSDDDALPIDSEAKIISEQEMSGRLGKALEGDLLKLRLLRNLIGPYVHLESPPPVRRNDWIEEKLKGYTAIDPGLVAEGVSEPGYRYRTWRLANRIIKAELDRMGCGYVSVPTSVCGEAGMLRPSHGRDPFHGNNHFGEAMLRELERIAR